MPEPTKLTPPQSRFFISSNFATAFVGGFGSGKSEGLFNRMLTTKLMFPQNDLGYFAPSYTLIRDIAYPRLEPMLEALDLDFTLNRSENVLKIKNAGKILFRTMDNPAKIVGFEIMDGFIDELDTLSYTNAKDSWEKIIARCRQKPRNPPAYKRPPNQLFVGTTPEGYKFVWKMWESEPPPGYQLIRAKTESNPHLSPEYIENLRNTYPAELIEAYLNGEFVNLNGKAVYFCFSRTENATDHTMTSQGMDQTLHVGADFNVRNMSAVIHRIEPTTGHPLAVSELTKLRDTPDLIQALNKLRDAGQEIIVYPDASGDSNRSIDANASDLKLLRDAKFPLRNPHSNPSVKDRVNSMNGMFKNANGERRYLINHKECPQYTDALEKQVWLPNGSPEKDPNTNIDDLNDGAGYFIHNKFGVDRPTFSTSSVSLY